MVRLQGGNPNCLDRPDNLVHAKFKIPIEAKAAGHVQEVDAELIGKASVVLGAGRSKLEDKLDHSVGIMGLKKIGDSVGRGEPLALIYANSEERLATAKPFVKHAFKIGAERAKPPKLIVGEI